MYKILSVILIVTLTPLAIGQEDYPELWEQVYRYELKDQLKTALVKVDGIYAKAKKENNDSQLIKALVYQSKFSLTLEEDAQFSVVKRFEQHIATSTAPAKNILQSMLANLYWEYFKANRWKLYNRTQSIVKNDKTDFRTWDLTTLFSEINHYYKASTTDESVLQKSKIKDFYEILQLHKDSKKLHPTLYDFLLQNSLEFFKNTETSILKPSYKFTVSNSALLTNANSFMEIPLVTKDTLSQSFNALVAYQKLLKHQYQNRYQDAFVNTDIERIRFIEKHATFPNKEQQFLETLHTSSKEFKTYTAVGYYTLEIARRKNQQAQTYRRGSKEIYRYKNNEAIELCDEILTKFPRNTVATKALALKENIQASTLDITSEKHIPVGMYSKILVNYKNIKNLRFSIYKMGSSAIEALQKKYKKEAQITGITKQPKITSWSCSLPDTKDFQKHSTEVGIPKLEQGYYIILAESTPDDSKKAITAFSAIQVTDIALIANVSNTNSYQVVNRTSGKPLAKAYVTFSSDPKNKNNKSLYKSFTTDKNGEFSFKGTMQYYYDITAKIQHKRDTATFSQLYINPRRNIASKLGEARHKRRTFLFTDRSIYRPGQIVYCKGILLQNSKDNNTVLANKTLTVRLKDSNYQTVQELSVTTNTFGSFSTEFLLPNTGLTGSYTIEASVEDQKITLKF
ncbi:MG2 domain-containing protein [Tenacibaculum sp. SG-28]|uniref:MG2 domain-containing protein n=1 Tax=Tenacibaculum sp. SG-28 TaxID=754426 RepID=UPI000CF4C8EA|nr:MG2 domain-containing protein [Tenacibaculum sp. SG-28]PQJ20635.1 hypothetical protein BSU00_10025 [Tenacibaculum sp. SG-28]